MCPICGKRLRCVVPIQGFPSLSSSSSTLHGRVCNEFRSRIWDARGPLNQPMNHQLLFFTSKDS